MAFEEFRRHIYQKIERENGMTSVSRLGGAIPDLSVSAG